jgi:hypothetical protein
VRFPENYDLKPLEFQVSAEYVAAPLQGIDDDRLDRGDVRPHDAETRRIGGHLRAQPDGYVLTCPQPVPGMIYKLRWRFREQPSAGSRQELMEAARITAARGRLLRMTAAAATDSAARSDWERARSILEVFAGDIHAIVPGEPEELHVSVMVFDEGCNRLKFICSNAEPESLPAADFFSGEGYAGFAFEKARSILYHPSRDPLGYFIHGYEWPAAERLREPVVLASFPWIHNPGDHRRRFVVGVVNIESNLATTKLLRLFDAPEDEQARVMKQLQDLANLTARRLLDM